MLAAQPVLWPLSIFLTLKLVKLFNECMVHRLEERHRQVEVQMLIYAKYGSAKQDAKTLVKSGFQILR